MSINERLAFIEAFTDLLKEVWLEQNQLRFGQFLENLFECVENKECIFYRDDQEVKEALEDILEADIVAFE